MSQNPWGEKFEAQSTILPSPLQGGLELSSWLKVGARTLNLQTDLFRPLTNQNCCSGAHYPHSSCSQTEDYQELVYYVHHTWQMSSKGCLYILEDLLVLSSSRHCCPLLCSPVRCTAQVSASSAGELDSKWSEFALTLQHKQQECSVTSRAI